MLQKIKAKINTWLQNKQKALAQTQQMNKMEKYYLLLREGSLFVQFIQKDLKKQQSNVNRHQRRNWQRAMVKEGVFTEELIAHYAKYVDSVLAQIDAMRLAKKSKPKVTVKKEEKKDDNSKIQSK